jgi:hypothetical protein
MASNPASRKATPARLQTAMNPSVQDATRDDALVGHCGHTL